ncbi:MAG TPA: MaoC/PaaZ C-terminal domain-containing protein [Gaiellaceae bacterium]|nr:MaoC/PaaZ C-terminal domain-containing protein [Gaiellaceae bacterium]
MSLSPTQFQFTGDRNPLHYDTELASRTRFGSVIVQGGVTSGLLNAVVAEDIPGPGSAFLHSTGAGASRRLRARATS